MNDADRAQLEIDARRLREIAERVRRSAPSVSVRAAALASEIELRIRRQEALHVGA